MTDRPTLSTRETAELLGVNPVTVQRLVKRGELEAYKLTPGQTSPLRIYKDSIESLLERREQQPTK